MSFASWQPASEPDESLIALISGSHAVINLQSLDGLEEIPDSVDLFQASETGRAPERYYISTGVLY